MQRKSFMPRPQWQRRCEEGEFQFLSVGGLYWDEAVAYQVSREQVKLLEGAVCDLHQRCLDTVDWIISHEYFEPFQLPAMAIDEIRASWQRQDKSLYGRLDFSWNGNDVPKLLEYSADAPAGLIESSLVQWFWLQDVMPHASQFNTLHERLIDAWRGVFIREQCPGRLHFCAVDGREDDVCNALYMMDIAQQAGLTVSFLPIDGIGYDSTRKRLVDNAACEVNHCYKHYPWEWLWFDKFAGHISTSGIRFIEPAWKLLLSSQAIMPLLWQRYPDHPNLLPASFGPDLCGPCVRKPLYSRDGSNLCLNGREPTRIAANTGGSDQFIYQAFAPLPRFDDSYAVVGVWVVDDQPAGLGIREDATLITRYTSRFVPHYVG